MRAQSARHRVRPVAAGLLPPPANPLGPPESGIRAVREVIKATGVPKGKHRRALGSTVLDDAIATQATATQIIAAIREAPGADQVVGRAVHGPRPNRPGQTPR